MQKVEGNVTFHTARSTAFPQPAPGTAPSAGPMKVPDDKLRTLLHPAAELRAMIMTRTLALGALAGLVAVVIATASPAHRGHSRIFAPLHPHMTGTIVVEAATGMITPPGQHGSQMSGTDITLHKVNFR